MPEKEINISYESLFELLRREKNRDELQQLNGEFFQSVIDYLIEMKMKLEDLKQKADLQSVDEKARTQKQLDNVKKIISELYERREKKVIDMAINKSRTSTNIVDTSNLLAEEKILFDALVDVLNTGRKDILTRLLSHELPKLEAQELPKVEAKKETEHLENAVENNKGDAENLMIRFTAAVPKFVGPELEIYGPFEPEDMASLPKEIADVLVKKNRAELMGE